jgi:hypothetical protein
MAMAVQEEDSPVFLKIKCLNVLKLNEQQFFVFLKELLDFLLRVYPAVMAELEGSTRSHAFDG